MIFKTAKIEQSFNKLDYRVKIILVALDVRRSMLNQPNLCVTSTIRKDGVHATTRAADVGVNGLSSVQRTIEAGWLCHHFPRKGKYRTALLHDVGKGMHIHIQVAGTKDSEYFEAHSTVLERI